MRNIFLIHIDCLFGIASSNLLCGLIFVALSSLCSNILFKQSANLHASMRTHHTHTHIFVQLSERLHYAFCICTNHLDGQWSEEKDILRLNSKFAYYIVAVIVMAALSACILFMNECKQITTSTSVLMCSPPANKWWWRSLKYSYVMYTHRFVWAFVTIIMCEYFRSFLLSLLWAIVYCATIGFVCVRAQIISVFRCGGTRIINFIASVIFLFIAEHNNNNKIVRQQFLFYSLGFFPSLNGGYYLYTILNHFIRDGKN